MALDLDSLNCILFSLAQFSILARPKFAYASASDCVFPWVRIAKLSTMAIILEWLENSGFKRALCRMFQNPGPQQDYCGHPIETFLSTL